MHEMDWPAAMSTILVTSAKKKRVYSTSLKSRHDFEPSTKRQHILSNVTCSSVPPFYLEPYYHHDSKDDWTDKRTREVKKELENLQLCIDKTNSKATRKVSSSSKHYVAIKDKRKTHAASADNYKHKERSTAYADNYRDNRRHTTHTDKYKDNRGNIYTAYADNYKTLVPASHDDVRSNRQLVERVKYADILQLNIARTQKETTEDMAPFHTDERHPKRKAFVQWGRTYTNKVWPHLWKVAYAVPPIFLNNDCAVSDADVPGAMISRLPESEARGDAAHRKVFDAFRLLNSHLETEGKDTMLIITRQLYENILIWLTNAPEVLGQHYVRNKCPDVCMARQQSDRYFSLPSDSSIERHELNLLILHREKGIFLVQVRAIGGFLNTDVKTTLNKVTSTFNQLDADERILNCVVGQDCSRFITKVAAFPNLSRHAVESLPIAKEKKVSFLCKEDIPVHDINVAESEVDLKEIHKWWTCLPSRCNSDDSVMKDIIARYVGVLSTPVKFEESSQRSHVRSLGDSVLYTARRSRRMVITQQQKDILNESGLQRVYISAPPGCGKTMMLILKSKLFLTKVKDCHVVVVNMYRGAEGRAIGHAIYSAIKNVDIKRVHHIKIDIGDHSTDFLTKFHKLLRPVISDFAKVMFVLDEIHNSGFCDRFWKTFLEEFKYSTIWCAGILGQNPNPKCFQERQLNVVLRCPPSIQNVLYQVDWDKTRKHSYTCDTSCREISTNGPPPLSIRHGQHNPSICVTECSACAVELALLLNDKDKLALTGGFISSPTPGDGGIASTPLPCSIAILLSIPELRLQDTDQAGTHLEPTKETFHDYMNYIDNCSFIRTLRENVPVKVKVITSLENIDFEDKSRHKDMLVAWIDTYLGLESDVVVFVPGDNIRLEKRAKTTKPQDLILVSHYRLYSKSSIDSETDKKSVGSDYRLYSKSSIDSETDKKSVGSDYRLYSKSSIDSETDKKSVGSDYRLYSKSSIDSETDKKSVGSGEGRLFASPRTLTKELDIDFPLNDCFDCQKQMPAIWKSEHIGIQGTASQQSYISSLVCPRGLHSYITKYPYSPAYTQHLSEKMEIFSPNTNEFSATLASAAEIATPKPKEFATIVLPRNQENDFQVSAANGPSKSPLTNTLLHRRLLPAFGVSTSSKKCRPRSDIKTNHSGREKTVSDIPPAGIGLASFSWRVEDIKNYSEWDKTNLFLAASRCVAQLILLVP